MAIAWKTSGMESTGSVNEKICLNFALFLHHIIVQFVYCLSNEATQDFFAYIFLFELIDYTNRMNED